MEVVVLIRLIQFSSIVHSSTQANHCCHSSQDFQLTPSAVVRAGNFCIAGYNIDPK